MSKYGELELKRFYYSPEDDILVSFFIPVLKTAVEYDRAVGFFSSSSLVEASVGICEMAKKGGTIRIITSPRLSQEDVEAIKSGYDLVQISTESLIKNFGNPEDKESLDRLSFLSNLVASGVLQFKIAVLSDSDGIGTMFHPKFGIVKDEKGNMVSFSGSLNASVNGLGGNWEQMHVATLQDNPQDVIELKEKFDEIWNGNNQNLIVFDFPKVARELLLSYQSDIGEVDLDQELLKKYNKRQSIYFKSPSKFTLRPYQQQAINKWFDCNFHGIFNMATGTGKTKTALCALESLYNEVDLPIYTIIVAPQKHLVDQWVEEVKEFDVNPIVGHSESPSLDWQQEFRRSVMRFNNNPRNQCLVTTVSSFSSAEIQEWVKKISRLAVVMDEAHNMGSYNRLKKLPDNAQYRLALSATIDRYNDKRGSEQLKDYFGEECICFPIDMAIGRYLTKYMYYPVACEYSSQEYDKFIQMNERLETILTSSLKKSSKEAAIVEYKLHTYALNAQINSKFDNLESLLKERSSNDHMLIYCGKTRIDESEDYSGSSKEEGMKIIDKTSQLVGMNGLGIKISRVTYQESLSDRREIFANFEKGDIDGIVAISCLDEGVDIPSIKTAFIMTSGDNPREYIQRRGRVLRQYDGKEYAEIFDFIVTPRKLSTVSFDGMHRDLELKMLAKEIRRMKEFSRVSSNPEITKKMFEDISLAYGISVDDIERIYGGDKDGY